MNIGQPISSEIESVEFTFLTPREIKAIAVKRIENDSTFDNLLNPVPGGLYDPALGSWGDSPCTTCHLNQSSCPGHPGYIQLPVPVYHPVFMDQAYRLLRATCVVCNGFRLSTKELHKYICKLRLLQNGLLNQAHVVESIGENDFAIELQDTISDESEAEEEGISSIDPIIRKRERYVQQCLQGNRINRGESKLGKHQGATEMRREVIKEFMAEITKKRLCASCGAISPAYRKDRSVKIFEKALSDREKAKMAQKGLKWNDAMTWVSQAKAKPSFDEGVADVGSPPDAEMEMEDDDDDLDDEDSHAEAVVQRYISPMEVKARLTELFNKEQALVSLLYDAKPRTRSSPKPSADMFFMTVLLIPPNRYRPEARQGDVQVTEAQQNSLYKSVLRGCERIFRVHKRVDEARADVTQLHQAWTELQEAVNALVDKSKNPVQGVAALRNEDGIKQMLEKKEGLFRKNMMGKRVNYAARSVISPDPNIETNEIGVPMVFAKKLTYPEPVTSHNFREMQEAVKRGVDDWPGAFGVEHENGHFESLRNKSADQRLGIANSLLAPVNSNAPKTRNKKVYRHLTNGDVVLMNRQPTLHKPSIMGHRVRVLPGEKTIRMHYANCKTYNADFDGDEMNMHFPQNEVARAEALQIADTDHQYLSGTAGEPLRGLIQDHLSVSVALCSRDTFFNRGDYQQLVYNALRSDRGETHGERIQLVPPAILKPVHRWTGKQVFTTILANIRPRDYGGLTMEGKSQIKSEQWGDHSEEGSVLFQDGEFITGILDKAQIGPNSGGLIHSIHEIYGPEFAGILLSSLGRLLTRYLHMRAFSCGMDDLRLTPYGEKVRRLELDAADRKGLEIASGYVSLDQGDSPTNPLLLERLEEVLRDDHKQEALDLLMNSGSSDITNAVQKACIPGGLEKPFPKNQMQAMTTSGAKGSRVNASLISCNLGQQVLEGRRVPVMVSGKSLPCFNPFDSHVRAGGYIVNRFLTGIRPQEYYFHHMAGREGLIDTAVKTSRSGYLQRCIIKGMEGLTVGYDTTVRDADSSIIQFLYGEDGLDITKQKYLTDFKFILQNATSESKQLKYESTTGEKLEGMRAEHTKYMKRAIKHAKSPGRVAVDPLISKHNPATNAFATSENFYEAMSSYIKENKDKLIRVKGNKDWNRLGPQPQNKQTAESLFAMKYVRSLVEPGEAVGIVAGQSIGEPSTQMTLNTFHLAGHSSKNVTLGIPRLREILMTASSRISTPAMTLHPLKELSAQEVDMFSKSISILPLADILDSVGVEERVGKGAIYGMAKIYQIRVDFFPAEEYTGTYGISAGEAMDTVERRLLPRILSIAKKEIRKRIGQEATASTPAVGVAVGTVEMAATDQDFVGRRRAYDKDDDDGDDDATNAKQKANRSEAVSYGPNDEEDNDVQESLAQEVAAENEDEDEGFVGSPSSPSKGYNNGNEQDEMESDSDEVDGYTTAKSAAKDRAERVREAHAEVTAFDCDDKMGQWCEVTLEFDAIIPKILILNVVQDAVKQTVVRQTIGVGRATVEVEKDVNLVQTSGVNLRAMQGKGSYIDVNQIETNDIAAVLLMYGVEACRNNIVRELSEVFGSHGIKVDNRHLNLIADYMTRNGGFSPFNRAGLTGNVSPFTKMSFETTLAFLKDAVLDGDWDDLTTPSSRLVMGKLSRVGTGTFDILTRLPTHYVDSWP